MTSTRPLTTEQLTLARILAKAGTTQREIAARIYASRSAVQNRWHQIIKETAS